MSEKTESQENIEALFNNRIGEQLKRAKTLRPKDQCINIFKINVREDLESKRGKVIKRKGQEEKA